MSEPLGEWPTEMNINLEFEENTDAFQAQMMIIESLKTQFEEAGMGSPTIEQWELLKTGNQHASAIFCHLIDQEIAKLKGATS